MRSDVVNLSPNRRQRRTDNSASSRRQAKSFSSIPAAESFSTLPRKCVKDNERCNKPSSGPSTPERMQVFQISLFSSLGR
jgi:hypothetical protein